MVQLGGMWNRRADGVAVPSTELSATRRIMPFLMGSRNESAVYFEQHPDLTRTEAFLARYNREHPEARATLFHVVTWACARVLHERPRLNRFVAGGRLYQRDGVDISYSAKKALRDGAPVLVLKRRVPEAQPFSALVAGMQEALVEGRSPRESYTDKELRLLLALPGFLLALGVRLLRFLDHLGLLPLAFIRNDPMYASLFIANLGSLKMDAAYHHLYEYGTIGLFCVIGQTHERVVLEEGQVRARRTTTLRFSFDERVEDGMYAGLSLGRLQQLIEDPEAAGAG